MGKWYLNISLLFNFFKTSIYRLLVKTPRAENTIKDRADPISLVGEEHQGRSEDLHDRELSK